jgi:hypothetical protein
MRVLFIGNSLTYANDLPAIIQSLAEADGQEPFVFEMIACADYSLEDHWRHGPALHAIQTEKWDVVVLQQGPSALPENRVMLREYTRRFADETKRANARPALYMVWPSKGRFRDFDRVSESYRLAAQDVQGSLLPVGEAWRSAWRQDPQLKLYSFDGLHPTFMGSYLAALVMYQRLYKRTLNELPEQPLDRKFDWPLVRTKLLQAAATEANALFGSGGNSEMENPK